MANSCTEDTVDAVQWSRLAPIPTARYSFGMVEYKGIFYAIGGYNASGLKSVEAYDPASNSWQTKADMPTARGFLVVAKAGSKIYAIGGITGADFNGITYVLANEAYDPEKNKWTSMAPLPLDIMAVNSVLGNQFITGAAVDDKIYVMVGSAGADAPTYIYDASTDTWSDAGAAIGKFHNEPYTAVALNNEIFVNAGNEFLKYIPSINEWRLLSPLSIQRYASGLAASGEKIYAVGGYRYINDFNVYTDVESYSPGIEKWSRLDSLSEERYSAAAIEFNGKLYVAGGASAQSVPLSFFEVLKLE